MIKLAAAETQSEWGDASPAPAAPEAEAAAARMVARVRLLMIISGLTTLIAIAAVAGVIGYRVYRSGAAAVAAADKTITLPKGARVIATAAADDRIVVTLDTGGAVEIRTFDLRTLNENGRIRFATEP